MRKGLLYRHRITDDTVFDFYSDTNKQGVVGLTIRNDGETSFIIDDSVGEEFAPREVFMAENEIPIINTAFRVKFKKEADFKTDSNLTFGKDAKFKNTIFLDNAYFNNRVFEDFADFHEADFKKVACFYSVTFKKPVNFSSIIFNGALNFVNAKTDFTYKELKELIETQIKCDKSIDNIKRTNDFRDGFRLMKYNLNNKGNALDASLFHHLELYCKELELEFTLENTKDKNSEKSKEVKPADETKGSPKDKNRIEILLDLITLKLYRNISDHHTNLLRIINFMVLTIAAYGLCFYIFDIFLLETIIANPKALVFSIILCYIAGLIVYMNLDIKQSAVAVIATLICVFYGIS